MTSRPLRFLALVLGGWISVRAALLIPGWWNGAAVSAPAAVASPRPPAAIASGAVAGEARPARQVPGPREPWASTLAAPAPIAPAQPGLSGATAVPGVQISLPDGRSFSVQPVALPPLRRPAGRWTASAWLLIRRDGGGPGLTPGGTLAGSQAGARISYRFADGLSFSARVYAPLRRPAGAEAAAGVAWRPAAAIPIDLLAERRQALGPQGRSAFSITAHGGGSLALPAGLRLDTYMQAGIVGLRSRDAFVDGAARVGAPVGPIEVGAGLWGAAQPGASRLDAGPTLSYRLPIRGANLRVVADWRFRVAGDAAPGSGPALILAADF